MLSIARTRVYIDVCAVKEKQKLQFSQKSTSRHDFTKYIWNEILEALRESEKTVQMEKWRREDKSESFQLKKPVKD